MQDTNTKKITLSKLIEKIKNKEQLPVTFAFKDDDWNTWEVDLESESVPKSAFCTAWDFSHVAVVVSVWISLCENITAVFINFGDSDEVKSELQTCEGEAWTFNSSTNHKPSDFDIAPIPP